MYIADLHIHSHYSRATSRDCTPENIDLWARRKGIGVVGTGDFTHPAWLEELREKLEPAEEGLYALKKAYRIMEGTALDTGRPRFVVTGEISLIYKKYDRVRKIHCLILLPSLESAEKLSEKLAAIGNIHSDGRPILGMDAHDLLELQLELCPEGIFVPAHIWTPHFSLFGAFSGFDSMEECFGDLAPHIHAVETGLSSDPPMNWRVSALDRFQMISNSDAHSPAKLGREGNLLDTELSYEGLQRAVQTGTGLWGTIEFFPEEGKYHYDGHRKCNLCLTPEETEKYHGICPICGKKLTIGVSHRIQQLADRAEGYQKAGAAPFESLVPLPEVIAAATGVSAGSIKVQKEYIHMLQKLGPEFEILRKLPLEEIKSVSGRLIAEGIGRLRKGQVTRIPGFDGEYGSLRLFTQAELECPEGQISMFLSDPGAGERPAKKEQAPFMEAVSSKPSELEDSWKRAAEEWKEEDMQREAARSFGRVTAVIAGPGTGKTHTLIQHIVYLIEERKVKPSQITAVTFTNQAASEIRERVKGQLGRGKSIKQMQIGTFHAIALKYLKDCGRDFILAAEEETGEIAEGLIEEYGLSMKIRQFLRKVSEHKTGLCVAEEEFLPVVEAYQKNLRDRRALDFDDLLLEALKTAGADEDEDAGAFTYLLVDEFQDISPVQYQLVRAWNRKGRELFVIGDPDQAIYGFRGAEGRCFEKLAQEYPQMNQTVLERNYRSTPQILSLSLEVIAQNPGGRRRLLSSLPGGRTVRLVKAESGMSEAIFVAKEINRLAGGLGMLEAQEALLKEERQTRSFDDIAVLYRTHKQARLLETCLKKEGIPYVTAGRDDFLMDAKVRGSICFFKSLLEEENGLAGQQAQKFIFKTLKKDESSTADGTAYEKLREKYKPFMKKKRPGKVLEEWRKELHLEENGALDRLCRTAVFYQTMENFLKGLELGVESDIKCVNGKRYLSGAVTLMTLHGSKGLEFPTVILYGARKGLIPLESEGRPVTEEEERRLLYVGMTRAKEELILTASREESCFLQALPESLLKHEKAGRRRNEEAGEQLSLFDFGYCSQPS